MADLVEIAGLWRKEGARGAYYGGKTKEELVIPAGAYISVFKNDDATDENRKPNLRVLFSVPADNAAPAPRQTQRHVPAQRGGRMADDLDDDIPFKPCAEA